MAKLDRTTSVPTIKAYLKQSEPLVNHEILKPNPFPKGNRGDIAVPFESKLGLLIVANTSSAVDIVVSTTSALDICFLPRYSSDKKRTGIDDNRPAIRIATPSRLVQRLTTVAKVLQRIRRKTKPCECAHDAPPSAGNPSHRRPRRLSAKSNADRATSTIYSSWVLSCTCEHIHTWLTTAREVARTLYQW